MINDAIIFLAGFFFGALGVAGLTALIHSGRVDDEAEKRWSESLGKALRDEQEKRK